MYGRAHAAAMLLALLVLAGCGGGGSPHARTAPRHARRAPPASRPRAPHAGLRVAATTRLPSPVQLPGLAVARGVIFATGGLDARSVSVAGVVRVGPGAPRRVGSLPLAVHDAAAATY